jgi:nitrogen-specific signal transduction histidine kinase/CheY-like chemotaxis protein
VEGVVLGIIGISRDITERNKAEEEKQKLALQLRQAQKMEAIGTLAGGIAHDFNNILSAIIGYTELSKGIATKDDKLSEYLTEVLAAGNRAKDLVKQILTFSRMGEQSNLGPIQIQPIVKEAMKLLRASIPTTIAIKQDIRPDTGLIVGNLTQVHQILINLCTNAYHAMQQNGGVLSVRLYSTKLERSIGHPDQVEPGRYNVLEVSDTGDGMDEETLDRIFEPYFTTKEQGKGTGMGLAVVHGIVKSYGGHIVVDSEPGKGSTFQIYLPQVDTVSPPLLDEEYFEAPQGSERILLVDDETVIVKVVKRMLEGLGYHVQAEVSSRKAFNLFVKNPDRFDLVITDMTMPEMTGVELAEKLISARPDIPIILCSGYSETINPQKLEAAGIREFLMKPLSRSELSLLVRKVLDQA